MVKKLSLFFESLDVHIHKKNGTQRRNIDGEQREPKSPTQQHRLQNGGRPSLGAARAWDMEPNWEGYPPIGNVGRAGGK